MDDGHSDRRLSVWTLKIALKKKNVDLYDRRFKLYVRVTKFQTHDLGGPCNNNSYRTHPGIPVFEYVFLFAAYTSPSVRSATFAFRLNANGTFKRT